VPFLGARPDAAALPQCADVVLVPHRRLGGTITTLEAMAIGRAVVATRLPHLEALIRDGAIGLLATPADQPALARA
jgi:glycosyltransferase involved in cell wall biosynthesis